MAKNNSNFTYAFMGYELLVTDYERILETWSKAVFFKVDDIMISGFELQNSPASQV